MGAKAPQDVYGSGELYRWKQSRDVPDTLNAILRYPEGFTVNLSSTFNNSTGGFGFDFLGTGGDLAGLRELRAAQGSCARQRRVDRRIVAQ